MDLFSKQGLLRSLRKQERKKKYQEQPSLAGWFVLMIVILFVILRMFYQ